MILTSDYLKESRRTLLKKRVRLFVAISTIFLVGAYFAYQTSDAMRPPELEIAQPADGATLDGPVVVVEGFVTPGIRLTVYGVEAYSGNDGRFYVELLLPAGLHVIGISAENRFGKTSSLERRIVVK